MAVAVYATDLAIFDDAESATGWVEVTGYLLGGTPEDDTDYFIYGTTQCITQENRKTGLHSIAFAGTAVTLPTDGVFLIWEKFLAPNAMDTEANGGMRILVGSSSANFYGWKINGSDTYPYGGWVNLAIDPTIGSPDYTTGTPAGTYACMGIGLNLLVAISKGNPHGCDIIRYGRGESRYTVGDATTPALFSGFAAANDAVTARWGLFQDVGGSYLFKGLMSLGLSATAVYMDDSNVVITIDNTKKVSAGFNAIEMHNAGSTIKWTNVSFTSLCIVSKGTFEMVDNATHIDVGGSYTNMGTFIYQSGALLTARTWRNCGLVTQGGATLTDCFFDSSASTPALLVDDMDLVSGVDFISAGTGHAFELTSAHAGGSFSLVDCNYNGYGLDTTTDAVIYNNSGGAVTLNVSGGDTPTVRNGTGASTTLVSPVVLTISGLPTSTELTIVNASTRAELFHVENTSGLTETYNYGSAEIGVVVDILCVHIDYDPHIGSLLDYTLGSTDATLPIALVDDPTYNNP